MSLAGVWHELRLAAIAWQFLTRIPLPSALVRRIGYDDQWLHDSARHFPLVGSLIGLVVAGVYLGALAAWGQPVAVVLAMAFGLWLTGGFHEDGWADVCDGLGGAVSRERALEIMKDSRIGAYGAMGLCAMLGLKAAALLSLPSVLVGPALVLGHTASRLLPVTLIRWLPYAGDAAHAKAKPFARQLGGGGWLWALAWVLMVGGALAERVLGVPAVAAAAGGAVMALCLCARWFRRRLGGYTGDCLGASQQLGEVAIYLGLLAALRWIS